MAVRIAVKGPFKGDYSLAVVNRNFAKALVDAGVEVSILSPNEPDLKQDEIFNTFGDLISRLKNYDPTSLNVDVLTVNDWPMVESEPSIFTSAHCFAWEESLISLRLASILSTYQFVGTTAESVSRSFINSGVTSYIKTIGNGTDHIPTISPVLRPRDSEETFRFLHISSCFPRKGIDELIEAYFKEFSGSDKVELTIKTFRNPHNTDLDQKIERMKNSRGNPPLCRVTYASLSELDYFKLYADADCLVCPSYGEGFLFPAAEAILNSVPVITTGWGGQTDFCNDQSAWLIDYRLEKARSHVSASGSVWARPNIESLRSTMRKMASLSESEKNIKLRNGKDILSKKKWSDTIHKFLSGLQEAKEFTKSRNSFCIVSTFDQRCGIATYTEELINGIDERSYITSVITEDVPRKQNNEVRNFSVEPIWRRHSTSIPSILEYIKRTTADTVLIEHHPGILGWDMLGEIVSGLGQIKAVLELHSIAEGFQSVIDHRDKLSGADRIIVHNERDYLLAVEVFGSQIISLLPHGMGDIINRPNVRAPWAKSKNELGVFTSFGFASPHKAFHNGISACYLLYQQGYNVQYNIYSALPTSKTAIDYMKYCFELAEALGISDRVHFDFAFSEIQLLIRNLSRAHVGLVPYDDVNEGASGAVRVLLRADIPVITSLASVFSDLDGVCMKSPNDPISIARSIKMVMEDTTYYNSAIAIQREYASQTSWHRISKMIFGAPINA